MKSLIKDIWSAFNVQQPDDYSILPQTFLYLPGDPMDNESFNVKKIIVEIRVDYRCLYN